MRAMILAAGRGERLRPLTDRIPKPLVEVHGQTLIERVLCQLARASVYELVVNTAWLGEQLHARIGDGAQYGVRVDWSDEPPGALETGGGIRRALPLLGDEPFIVVNADVYSDFDFATLDRLAANDLGHLILVDNPDHHPDGDFGLDGRRVHNNALRRLTYAGIAVLHPNLFDGEMRERFSLAPLLRSAAERNRLSGTHFTGLWSDVGTAERLAELEQRLMAGGS
ncbi:MAG: nucleotidyltransferase family protein [Chromatiales bacterium]|nr:nucleotidyltransferase family protein [Chromatiales bacterium]